ncbi:prespore-specific protein [Heterostelium album PN500]|uniref:Prespore-specific protein n=1 Tax=Heterostelium pallidum (strain ATCC 26659 / Pp 5 / PN500) TaxID=670386 RepID=D3AW94_HETP5|nr:prespore-specific protein [Heterostelium album PN500]EFA86567.1 prespore-specific protein [Heterostelium album PN500]|eukprot:XP_020438672.1 prespore-specific protein [Heterostelium album PN500]
MLTFAQLPSHKPDFKVDNKYRKMPSKDVVENTAKKLRENQFKVDIVNTEKEALDLVIKSIPKESSVMNCGSVTLSEIGLLDYLKDDKHGWRNLHVAILNEKDPAKQTELRRFSMASDYFLCSLPAVTKEGVIYSCDASGSRTGAMPFAAKNVVCIVGTQKIVENDQEAERRIWDFCLPCESVRSNYAYKVPGSQVQNLIRIANSNMAKERIHIIFVNKELGY